MEEQYVADRAWLRALMHEHPEWPREEYAAQIGRSLGWVKKWLKRLREAPLDDKSVLWGHSRARKHPPPSTSLEAIQRILDIRDHPPDHLQRTPGPKAILYYLHKPQEGQATGVQYPRSTRTIWRILTAHDRIRHRGLRQRVPVERPAPLTAWQLDFKDASTVPPEEDGKQQHVVEILNTVDMGTSILLASQVGEDFTAETVLPAVVETVRQYGLPALVSIDRDTRWVGNASGRDFPSPFVRFWQCLGVEVYICPPQRPDRNALVERFHRSLSEECLTIHRPTDVGQVREVTAAYAHHYNHERPHQAITCGNRPPRVAFPTLPVLGQIPLFVDPDGWLQAAHERRYARKVRRDGSVQVAEHQYYVKTDLAGQHVVLEVDAPAREVVVWQRQEVVKRLPIKGLAKTLLAFDDFVDQLCREAHNPWPQRRA